MEGQHDAGRAALGPRKGNGGDRVDPLQVEDLDFDQPPLAGAQHLFDQAAHLALPDHLQVVPAHGLPELEAAGEGLVGQDHRALVVHREHAVLHREEDGLDARPLAGHLAQALLQLVGREVEDACQLSELVAAPHPDPRGQVAGGELAGRVHDLSHRAGEGRGQGEAEQAGDAEGQEQGEALGASEVGRLLLDRLERRGHPRDPENAAAVANRDRGVEQVAAHGRAVTHGRAGPGSEGLPDLGPAAVVLQRGQVGAGNRGIGDHPAVRGHDRHPRPHLAGRLVHERVQLRRGGAARQPLLDHPGHEARLREQGRARLFEGALAQARLGQEVDGQEGGRGGGRRRHRHARAQSEGHRFEASASSVSR